jgi:hypothetical protein
MGLRTTAYAKTALTYARFAGEGLAMMRKENTSLPRMQGKVRSTP